MDQAMTIGELKRKISILPDDYEVTMDDECVVAISNINKPIKPENEVLDEVIAKIERIFVDPPKCLRPREFNMWAQGYVDGVQAAVDAIEELKRELKGDGEGNG